MFLTRRCFAAALLVTACGSTQGMGGPRSLGARSRMAVVSRASAPRFCIDRAPVTARDYAYFVRETRHRVPVTSPTESASPLALAHGWTTQDAPVAYRAHPVVLVSWGDAAAYCAWRSARLPTAEEWEFAAEGPSHARWPWGDRPDDSRANTLASGARDTTPVVAFPRGISPLGLSDVVGNVLQWTSTPHGADGFIAKGSAFDTDARDVFERTPVARDTRSITLGFRCASDCPP